MIEELPQHRFKLGQVISDGFESAGSVMTGEPVVAVAVRLANGRVNYFLTLGKQFHRRRLWEIAMWVLEKCDAFCLDGTPLEAEICYSLHDASTEPYFYEQYLQLIMTVASTQSDADRVRVRAELEKGNHLYFLGSTKQRDKLRGKYWSMK